MAVQDVRGKYRSEGVYAVFAGDVSDGYDTIDWLSHQPLSNGNVGTFGCSYLGDVQILLAQARHPNGAVSRNPRKFRHRATSRFSMVDGPSKRGGASQQA